MLLVIVAVYCMAVGLSSTPLTSRSLILCRYFIHYVVYRASRRHFVLVLFASLLWTRWLASLNASPCALILAPRIYSYLVLVVCSTVSSLLIAAIVR